MPQKYIELQSERDPSFLTTYFSRRNSWLKLLVHINLVVFAVCLIIWLVGWAISAIFTSSGFIYLRDTAGMLHEGFFPGGLFGPSPLTVFLVVLNLAFALVTWAYLNGERPRTNVLALLMAVVMILGACALSMTKSITNGILGSDYYLTNTTFMVTDTDAMPALLEKYDDHDQLEVNVDEGVMENAWVPRVASMTGALRVLSKTSSSSNSNVLMRNTITYLYGEGDSGVWTAIRNGKGQQDIFGISSWDGTGNEDRINTCRFTKDYALNKNFGGPWGNKNLWDSVASAYPSFYYAPSDLWGYCDGEEPVMVLPGVSLSSFDMRSVDAPSGVVTIRGSRSGQPVINMVNDVQPGDFPGPVYAQRLVDSQRGALDWSAGYYQSVNEHFGFDVTDAESQKGNNSNYLLKNKEDERLYWVTPMKPQDADEQTIIAYSVIPADELSPKNLNPQAVYILNAEEDSQRTVNLDDLESYAQDAACTKDANFCTDTPKGKIIEFLPVTDTHWQAFGEVDGRVKYLIDIEVGATIKTHPTALPPDQQVSVGVSTLETEGIAGCGTPSSLTEKQLSECLTGIAAEIQSRSNTGE